MILAISWVKNTEWNSLYSEFVFTETFSDNWLCFECVGWKWVEMRRFIFTVLEICPFHRLKQQLVRFFQIEQNHRKVVHLKSWGKYSWPQLMFPDLQTWFWLAVAGPWFYTHARLTLPSQPLRGWPFSQRQTLYLEEDFRNVHKYTWNSESVCESYNNGRVVPSRFLMFEGYWTR